MVLQTRVQEQMLAEWLLLAGGTDGSMLLSSFWGMLETLWRLSL